MLLDEMVPTTSNYLAKEDVGKTGLNLTIKGLKREQVGQGQNAETLAVMYFAEDVKPMVVKKTNKNRLKIILEAETTEDVIGKAVNVYNDPTVEFAGKITGGLRIREKQNESGELPDSEFDGSTPF